jgi:hypothetical protein
MLLKWPGISPDMIQLTNHQYYNPWHKKLYKSIMISVNMTHNSNLTYKRCPSNIPLIILFSTMYNIPHINVPSWPGSPSCHVERDQSISLITIITNTIHIHVSDYFSWILTIRPKSINSTYRYHPAKKCRQISHNCWNS